MNNNDNIDLIPNLHQQKLRMLVDNNHGVFKYGLTDNPLSYYEDPTYLGFTIEIDEMSPIFTLCGAFIDKNKRFPDIKNRESLYESFCSNFKMLFNSQESAGSTEQKRTYIKQHYINAISGLHNLTKKFVEFKEDKLTFELYEDISLFSTYLLQSYNNLRYSYEYGRVLIPENLLYFNLYLKISEVRNMTSIRQMISSNVDDVKIARALKRNTTSMVYKLTDCLINSYESVPFDDQMSLNGIDANRRPESTTTFDMFYKRINLVLHTPLIPGSKVMDNADSGLRITMADSDDGLKDNIDVNNEDIDKNTINKDHRDEYLKDSQTSLNAFRNINIGASDISTLSIEGDNKNITEYQKALDIMNEYNEETNVTDMNRNKTDKERLIEINKKLSTGNRTSETDRLIAEKTKIEKAEDGWNDIRQSNIISDFYNSRLSEINGYVDTNIGGGVGNKINQSVNSVSNQLKNTMKQYENMINKKKNELINIFVQDIKEKTNLLLDYNVYTDDVDPMLKPIDDFTKGAANTILDDLFGGIIGGTDTNII